MSRDDIARWDARYRDAAADWPDDRDPHPFLLAQAARLPTSGTALDIAAGLGRNSFWLARRGLRVTAVDGSSVACERVRARARELGLAVTVLQRDLERAPLPDGPFDLVVNTRYLQRALASQIEAVLAPAGVLVFSTYLQAGIAGRAERRFGLRPGELASMFPALETLVYEEDDPATDRPAASLLARKPPA